MSVVHAGVAIPVRYQLIFIGSLLQALASVGPVLDQLYYSYIIAIIAIFPGYIIIDKF